MLYLTGSTSLEHEEAHVALGLGLMCTPAGRSYRRFPAYRYWAADTGCFANPGGFSLEGYLVWLARLATFTPDARARCLFATAPDRVGDAALTLHLSLPVLPRIRRLGYKAALVAQDGLEELPPSCIPWDALDCLFLGGSTTWKLSAAAEALTKEAKWRGKWVHMGRVNSERRFRLAESWGCDSADGTYLAFGPSKNLPQLARWLAPTVRQPVLL